MANFKCCGFDCVIVKHGEDTSTAVTAHDELDAAEAGADKKVNKEPKRVEVFSFWMIIQQIFDCVLLVNLIEQGFKASTGLLIGGMVIGAALRIGAVAQYFGEVGPVKSISNILLGTRFGYDKNDDPEMMRKADLSAQIGDPLILHCYADVIQQIFSGYAVFVLVFSGNDKGVIIYAAFVSVVSLLSGIATHLDYGHLVVMLAVYVSHTFVFFIYAVMARDFGELEQLDAFYTRDLTYAWIRFLGMLALAFVSIAITQNAHSNTHVPYFMFVFAILLTLFDLVSTIILQENEGLFFLEEPSREQRDFTEGLIHANLGTDILMLIHSFVNLKSSRKFADP